MAKITIPPVADTPNLAVGINERLQQIENEFNDKVHYRVNPALEANMFVSTDVDLNSNDILNVRDMYTTRLFIGGVDMFQIIQDAVIAAQAAQAASELAASEAQSSAVSAAGSAASAAVSAQEAQDAVGNLYALTDSDIANGTATSGTVSGAQLLPLKNENEVLKDWTSSTAEEVDLFQGIVFDSAGLERVIVEVRNMSGTQTGGSGINGNITLQAFNDGQTAVSTKSGRVTVTRLTGPSGFANNNFNFHDWGSSLEEGTYEITMTPQPARGGLGVKMVGTACAGTFDIYAETHYMAFFENSTGIPPTELWIISPAGKSLSLEYRVLRSL